jgi:poly(hydroxyalkanoate) depolymerase family esterase
MLVHARPRLRPGRPLVVVLHGCGRQAVAFAADSGWLALADEMGFALLLPEQVRDNIRGGCCFNWFHPNDVRRGGGEVMSIRQMLRVAVARYALDPKRIFIMGFSVGGGMAAAMLAAYPTVFPAGGVVAGVRVGCAQSQICAILHMRRADSSRTRLALAGDVRDVTGARQRNVWPRGSIWHGMLDRTVDPANAVSLVAQWRELDGQGAEPRNDGLTAGDRHRTWGRLGRPPAVELWTLPGIWHGFPIDPDAPTGGRTGARVVKASLFAARSIAAFWHPGQDSRPDATEPRCMGLATPSTPLRKLR